MDQVNKRRRSEIFLQELNELKRNEYISEQLFDEVKEARKNYDEKLFKTEVKAEVKIEKPKVQREIAPPKPKKVKTEQEIRERNITWSLVLGVIMVLMAGLIFATSNWDDMNAFVKTMSIGFLSLLFFGLNFISEKLKIEKTSFAFIVLSTLLFPITILSAGVFELFGEYLSVNGEGVYLLGALTLLLSLPIYIKQASKYKSRLFVWFSLLSASGFVAFVTASTYVPIDIFYLVMTLYNALIIVLYIKLKTNEKYTLFIKEVPAFAQISVILTTLLMLAFYNNPLFYSFNVLLVSTLYAGMMFVYKQKEYQFVFSAMVVYGLYQLIQHSFLVSIDLVLVASIGFIFLLFTKYEKNDDQMEKMFFYISSFVSGCAFIYVSVQGFLLQNTGDNGLLMIAYFFVFVNYALLSYQLKNRLFSYLSILFFVAAGYKSYHLMQSVIADLDENLYMFGVGVIVYLLFYRYSFKFTKELKRSSFDIANFLFAVTIFMQLLALEWTFSAGMFIVVGLIYFVEKNMKVSAIATMFGLWCFYDGIHQIIPLANEWYNIAVHFAVTGLVLLGISYALKENRAYFWSTYISYSLSLLFLITVDVNDWIRPIMFLIGAVLYGLFVHKEKMKEVWLLVSGSTLFAYLTLLTCFDIQNEVWHHTLSVLGSVLLLVVIELLQKKKAEANPYFVWLAHGYLICQQGLSMIETGEVLPSVFLLSIGIYSYSIWKTSDVFSKQAFLYKLYIDVHLFVYAVIAMYEWDSLYPYYGVITSGIIFINWYVMNEKWKKKIAYFLVPQMFIGLFTLDTNQYPLLIAFALVYVVAALYVIHKEKWLLLTLLPLIALVNVVDDFSDIYGTGEKWVLVYVVAFFAVKEVGALLSKKLYIISGKLRDCFIDWYFVTALYLIFEMVGNVYDATPLIVELIPYILLVYLLFTQVRRVDGVVKKIIYTMSGLSTLLPYYVILDHVTINQYIETELYVLPWIVLTILLTKKVWEGHQKGMRQIQLLVLLVVAAILLKDALDSNTWYDAVIMGSMSLVSMMAGMHYKIKSYFFVGSGLVLLNIFLQSKPFWGNMPWWYYLLVGGIALIGVSSFYEWQKNKKDESGDSLFQVKKRKIIAYFKKWN